MADQSTLLVLSTMGIPLYSARGLTQTLTPIVQAADLQRDINGTLIDLSVLEFRKYSSKVTCKDQQTPAIDGIWPGQIVTVSCVAELAGTAAAGRAAVVGSVRVENGFTFYRPMLQMLVMNYAISDDEWAAEIAWELSLEEI